MAKEKYYGFSDSKSKAEVPIKEEFEGRFKIIESGDVLDVKENGIYFKGSRVTGVPKGCGNGLLLVAYAGEENRVYVYIGTDNVPYIRQFAGGTQNDSGWIRGVNLKDIVSAEIDSTEKVYSAKYFNTKVGLLSKLATSVKTSVVDAINEVRKTLEDRTNGKVKIYSDAEGGNIRIISPNGTTWEMDAYKDYLRIYTMSLEGKYCGYTFGRDFINGGGSIATKEELRPVRDMLIRNVQTVGSAYGVTAERRSTTHVTSVYFTGSHVGDKMAAYTQRNMGTIPADYRPLTKVQSQVPGVNGLFLTVEPSGVVSMRNEHYAEISFSKLTISGCVTYMNE